MKVKTEIFGDEEIIDLNLNPEMKIIDGYLFNRLPTTVTWYSHKGGMHEIVEHTTTLSEKDGELYISTDGKRPEEIEVWEAAWWSVNGNVTFGISEVLEIIE